MEDILKKAEQARESLIPSKSEAVYQKEYKIYLDWLTRKNVMPKDVTETVFLAYFQELVVLIMGYFGGCRSQELLNMKISDIEDRDSVMVVNVPESKTGVSKKFTVVDEKEFSALPLLRLYMSLRPKSIERFFLSFRQNKCTSQPIGKKICLGKSPAKSQCI
ncbi:uncharacterized protein isoform X1 [Leptinotarsa decemlineata]|uniref:uncharacterized protein isoform X1 n=1 Tax=Leptinotarsa decemlineata TaxID=7539 RepID=UPI003D30675E